MPSASDVARISSAAHSDVGRTRTENQDAFGEFSSASGERLFVVADGMGGHRGGATASRLCVETLGRAFTDGHERAEERLRHGFELANARIHAAAQTDAELAGMGTTAVALVLAPDGSGALGWVGDSRAYRFSGGALERLSTDHSVVGEMIRAGVITEQEADNHPRRNELLRAIGPHEIVEPETIALRHGPGDRFLLCSDGLWGPVPEAEIAIVLGYETPDLAVKKLIAMANEGGGPDNVTAQIASVADPAMDLPLAAPPAVHRAGTATRSRLPLLASGAAVATAALIALAVYGVRQTGEPPTSAAPGEVTAQVAPTVAATEAPAVEPAPPVATKPPAPIRAAPPPPVPAAKTKAAGPKPAAPRPEPVAKPKPTAPKAEKPAAPKPATPKPEVPRVEKPAVAEPPAPVVAAATPPTAVPAPPEVEPAPPEAAAASPEVAPAPAEVAPTLEAAQAPEVAPAPEPPTPEPAQASASPASSLLAVEQFLLDWETAVASKDFALYTRLGLPGNEESFRTHYVENEARIDFSLRDFGPAAADELVVRVQMVLETQDPTGTQRVDEERSFVVRQTPDGLRYIGSQKD